MDIFAQLVFDKYAIYIWFSYGLTFVTIAFLFLRAKKSRLDTIRKLRVKYLRDL